MLLNELRRFKWDQWPRIGLGSPRYPQLHSSGVDEARIGLRRRAALALRWSTAAPTPILILCAVLSLIPIPSGATTFAVLEYIDQIQMACTVVGNGRVDLSPTTLCTAAQEALQDLVAGRIDSRVKQISSWANLGSNRVEECLKRNRDAPDLCEGQDDKLLYPDVQLPISVIGADHIALTEHNVATVVVAVARQGDTVDLSIKVIVPKNSDVPERIIEIPERVSLDVSKIDAGIFRESLRFILADFFSPSEINEMMSNVSAHSRH
jgi:hypothetical protein